MTWQLSASGRACFVNAARYLSEKSEGRFLVSAYPNPSPLDVANLLRGNAIFTDVYEEPEQFRHLLDCCLAGAITNMRRIAQATSNPGGGTFAFNRWIPQGALLLEDAADLISPKLYRDIGMPYTQRMIDDAGGAYLHHHSLGRHQYANMAQLRGLYVEQISSDPAPPATGDGSGGGLCARGHDRKLDGRGSRPGMHAERGVRAHRFPAEGQGDPKR